VPVRAEFQAFARQRAVGGDQDARHIGLGPRKVRHEPKGNRVEVAEHDDWGRRRCLTPRAHGRRRAETHEGIHAQLHQFARQPGQPVKLAACKASLDDQVAPFDVAPLAQRVQQRCRHFWGRCRGAQHAQAVDAAGGLRERMERQRYEGKNCK